MSTITMRKRMGRLLYLAVCCVTAAGCATTVKTNVLMPGNIDQVAKFKSVAVMPFEGPNAAEFTAMLESSLASVTIDDQQYFQIVDRGSMDKALQEMKLGMTGVVDADTAAQVGRMVGAKGIYTGMVTTDRVSGIPYTEERRKCDSYKKVTDNKGRQHDECTHWHETKVKCTKRAATFSFTPKLVEVETGRLIFSKTYDGSRESKGCTDDVKALLDSAVMQKQARKQALQQFRRDVAPYYESMEFALKDSADDIASPAGKAKLKDGIKFASSGRMDRACSLWSEAKTADPGSITLLYNLGVCAEVGGRSDEALALYKQADKLLTAPDDLVNKALTRVADMMEKREKLSGQVSQ